MIGLARRSLVPGCALIAKPRAAWLGCALAFVAALATVHSEATAAPAKPAPAAKAWHPAACPPSAAAAQGASSLKVSGPCAFEYTGQADCFAEFDDLTLSATRNAKNGAELMVYLNVERYVGAGRYKAPNDLFVSLKDKNRIYRWSGNDFEVTVGPGSKTVTVHHALLTPELPLVGCSGPQTNYQCDGRGDDPGHMASVTMVSGTISCKGGGVRR